MNSTHPLGWVRLAKSENRLGKGVLFRMEFPVAFSLDE